MQKTTKMKTENQRTPQLATIAERLHNMGNHLLSLSDRLVEGNNGRPIETHEKDLIRMATVPIIKEEMQVALTMYLEGKGESNLRRLDALLHEQGCVRQNPDRRQNLRFQAC